MEHIGTNNYSSNMIGGGHGNGNMSRVVNLGPEGGRMVDYIPQGGPWTSALQHTQESSMGSRMGSPQLSSPFTGLIHEQNYSLVHRGGRLVLELNSEGPSGANNNFGSSGVRGAAAVNDSSQGGQRCICGRKRKSPESEGILGIDLNQLPTNTDQELYCECENPSVQGIGSMASHANSSSVFGHTNNQQISQSIPEASRAGRNGRFYRRGTPYRPITSSPGGSSGQIPSHDEPPSNMSSVESPFRIRDTHARRENLLHALNIHSQPFEPVQHNDNVGSMQGHDQQHFHSPSFAAAHVSDSHGMTLGQTSNNIQNLHYCPAHGFMMVSNLQPQTNYHPESSLTQNFIVNPTQMVGQVNHQHAPGNFVGNLNEGQFVGAAMQSRFGVNGRDPRPNVQPIGNILQGVNSNNQRDMVNNDYVDLPEIQGPLFNQGSEVIEISDDENDDFDEFEELDHMHLDIEELTYEELLALEERMGVVDSGLTEEVIMDRLVRRYYRAAKNRPPEDAESCCICLADFKNRDVLGRINCTHKFHFDCIKQWLMEKNFCPICKQTALPPN